MPCFPQSCERSMRRMVVNGYRRSDGLEMASRVLWEIDTETSGRNFERLCIDLLHRNGYLDIVPIEPQDHGRDAEETPRPGRSGEGHPAYFQFSIEKDWKAKVRRDARTLEPRKTEFDTFVFVTSQTARGVDTDAFRSEFLQQYGWNLVVYGREWLRFQLEEKHPDLALRHLGSRSLITSRNLQRSSPRTPR